jgi:hypothetical protein
VAPQGLPPPGLAEYEGETDVSSLDNKETSVRRDFDAFMARQGSKESYFEEPKFDGSSLSACFRHSCWSKIRKKVYESMRRTGQNSHRMASFGACGSYSWIERSSVRPSEFRLRVNHCNDRLCTPCANERSRLLRDNVLGLISGKQISFITFTLSGYRQPLSMLLDRIFKHFKALRLHPLWSEAVKGGVAFLEVKFNDKSSRWHPHLHILADAKFIDQGELSTVWRTITKDSYIVDIRRVRDVRQTGHYVTKYASKPLNSSFANSQGLLDEALQSLKGRRLCFAFGSWYGKALTDVDLDGDDALDLVQANFAFFIELEELLHRVNGGNPDAMMVLKAIKGEGLWRATLEHSPP